MPASQQATKREEGPLAKLEDLSIKKAAFASESAPYIVDGDWKSGRDGLWQIIAIAFLLMAGVWAYWPILVELVGIWAAEPDYSHGFLVAPLSLYFLWVRRGQLPTGAPLSPQDLALAFTLLTMSCVLRYVGARCFFSFLDAWSILLWIAATVALMGGRPLLVWCLPSIGFLWFTVPLPFSLETALSLPLQRIATKISCWGLQLLGQPAFSEGNVIVIGEQRLEVAQACSGLRLFVGVLALAYAYIVLIRRSWLERLSVLAAVIPIAIVANAARIVLTGVMFQFWNGSGSDQMAHDVSGWAMLPFATLLFWFLLWYLGKLFPLENAREMPPLAAQAARRSQ